MLSITISNSDFSIDTGNGCFRLMRVIWNLVNEWASKYEMTSETNFGMVKGHSSWLFPLPVTQFLHKAQMHKEMPMRDFHN